MSLMNELVQQNCTHEQPHDYDDRRQGSIGFYLTRMEKGTTFTGNKHLLIEKLRTSKIS